MWRKRLWMDGRNEETKDRSPVVSKADDRMLAEAGRVTREDAHRAVESSTTCRTAVGGKESGFGREGSNTPSRRSWSRSS